MSSKATINAVTALMNKVVEHHGDDPEWKDLVANAAKCFGGISASFRATYYRVDIPGPLADKWDCEEVCWRWGYFIHHRTRTKLLLTGKCFFCGRFLPEKMRTRDHLWPKSKGGVNTVTACNPCNRTKGPMLPEQFRLVLFGGSATKFFAEEQMYNEHGDPK